MTGGDGAARAAQAVVQGTPRRRPRPTVVLRQGRRSARCASSRGSTPRSRATRWCSSTTTTSASPSAPAKVSSSRCCAMPIGCPSPQIEQKIREFAKAAEDGTPLARRSEGRHLHHHQRRRLRLAAEHADPQPAAGRHPRSARDQGTPGGVNGQVVVRPMMYIALTYDHRIVDGSEAVRFLVRVKELVEDPGALLLE